MKWLYGIRPKYKAAIIVAVFFGLVLGTHMMSERNVQHLESSFASVYEDRLVVESYIYKISDLLYRKKFIIDKTHTAGELAAHKEELDSYDAQIQAMLTSFGKTRLTEAEAVAFDALTQDIAQMETLEDNLMGNYETALADTKGMLDSQFDAASKNLNRLSQIQVAVGKKLKEESKKDIADFTLLSQFDMAMLILLGIVLQILIFTSGALVPKRPQRYSLN